MNRVRTSNEEGIKSQMGGESEGDKRVGPGQSLRSILECEGLVFIKWVFGLKA